MGFHQESPFQGRVLFLGAMLVLAGVMCGWDTLCLQMVSPEMLFLRKVIGVKFHTFTPRNVSTFFLEVRSFYKKHLFRHVRLLNFTIIEGMFYVFDFPS